MDRELHKKLEQRIRLTDAKDCGDIAVKKEKRDGKYPGKPAASGRDIGQPSNAQIRNEVGNMYQSFVLEVDPKDVLDLLIQRRVISIERKDEVMSKVTKQDRCRALLDQLLLCSHNEAFLVLRQALNKNYPWIVERIDKSINNEVISLAKRDLDPSKNNEVELNRQPDEVNRRIRELEKEVVEYRTKNLRLESELRVLQESYDEAKDGERNVKDELQTRLEQRMRLTDVEEYVDSTVKIAVKKETPTGKCPGNHLAEVQTDCLVLKEREIECSDIHLESLVESSPHAELVKAPPLPPRRSTSSTDLHSRETAELQTACLVLKEREIECSDLHLGRLVECTPHTELWKGRWKKSIDVSVKKLISSRLTETKFFVEAQLLDRLRHQSIVHLIGISSLAQPLQIVSEYLSGGNLRNYLKKDKGNTVDLPLIIDFARQIVDGMCFVASKGIVHGDLRARNILLALPKLVKISNFECALDLQKEQVKRSDSFFAVRWAAPEAVEFGRWTLSSDVWSFGILLYEMFTFGKIPYSGRRSTEVFELIKADYRLPCPQSRGKALVCPDTLYRTMVRCWDKESDARPSFQMLQNFEEFFQVPEACCETSHGYSQEMNKREHETASDERDMDAPTGSGIMPTCDIVQDKILARPLLVTVINGCTAVRGMALLDGWLYVVRFGSIQVEVYEARDEFKRSKKTITVASPGQREKFGLFHRLKSRPKKEHVSSGIQDIVSCNRNKRLYLSDWQNMCVHCIDPVRNKVIRSWIVESGGPWGISVTSEGNVVVSCGDSGQLCEYTAEGLLMRTIELKMTDEGPWHGLQLLGTDSWAVCYGGRYAGDGCVSVVDSEGKFASGYKETDVKGSSHLALLSSNHVLVAETTGNRIVLLNPSLSGSVREILNPDHGIMMPVRIHLCESSGTLVVGLSDGTVLVYQILDAGDEQSTAVSS